MKKNALMTLAALSVALVVSGFAQDSIFELGTAQPKYAPGGFKPAPENIHTRFGTLKFPNGYPTEETARKVY